MQRLLLASLAVLTGSCLLFLTACQNVDRVSSEGRPNRVLPNPDNKPSAPTTTLPPQTFTTLQSRVLCLSQDGFRPKNLVDSFLSSASERSRFDLWQILLDTKPLSPLPWLSVSSSTATPGAIQEISGDFGKDGKFTMFSIQRPPFAPLQTLSLVKSDVETLSGKTSNVELAKLQALPLTSISYTFSQQQDFRFFSHPADSAFILFPAENEDRFKLINLSENSVASVAVSPRQYFQPTLSKDGKWAAFLRQYEEHKLDLVACRIQNSECFVLSQGNHGSFTAQILAASQVGLIWAEQSGRQVKIRSSTWAAIPNSPTESIHTYSTDVPASLALFESGPNLTLVFSVEKAENGILAQGDLKLFRINSQTLVGENISEISYPEFLIGTPVSKFLGAIKSIQPAPWAQKIFFNTGSQPGVLAVDFLSKDWTSYRPDGAPKCRSLSVAPEFVTEIKK